ncbi:sensor histidine kinase [Streptomyces aidingensis]|uniref:histidine kinase n=1 Tax=Streptomyces aidingensis TaxID=910347 RepID=A0A1I1VGW1_9ACTN|nr:nitrate- and nitrite sensing domain-containing protein [Streptomyces aidingensis]SFD82025.1 Signal transduction histidine kinase [Streptomyces aidingensis]
MRRSTTTPPSAGESGNQRTAARGAFTPRPAVPGPPADTAEPPPAPPESGSPWKPRNWRVAVKLNAILLIPVLVALVFAGLRVNTHYSTWREAREAQQTAELVQASTAYAHALLHERDVTAEPLLTGDTENPVISEARRATDQAAADFDRLAAEMPDRAGLAGRLDIISAAEAKLDALRQSVYTEGMEGVQSEEGYVEIQNPLMSFSNELGLGSGNEAAYGRSVYAVSLAKSASSLQRSIGIHLLVAPGPTEADAARQNLAFSSYAYLEGIAQREYLLAATPEDAGLLEEALGTAQRAGARGGGPTLDEMVQTIASQRFTPEELARQGLTPEVWFNATTAEFEAYRALERELVDRAVADAKAIADEARTDMITNSALVLVALLSAFVVAALMARSMTLNMRRLRGAAQEVAENRLPALVEDLSRTDPGRVDTRVQPIPVSSRDELGEVARAFDQVHREAVRMAAEQALLRGNVNAIFTNLSSRNQGLIERQLHLITELENNEADPEQLESLFRLDHLATRMRRNGENLLVLAGEEPGRRWTEPVPLIDVLRAAASEVEDYDRIELAGVHESEIHGAVVNDLVHLLAELLENATAFSSPQSKVRVTATRLPDGRVMVEIHDKGIGLTAEDFADINHRLANPPNVDVEVSRRMGLFVVGRLAGRHNIRVQLRPSGEQTGTTSLVMLPEEITHGGGGQEPPVEDEFTVSRIVPDGPYVEELPPIGLEPTAADLGFDDSRYEQGATTGTSRPAALDPVGRSLRREERRGRLEARQQEQRESETPVMDPETQAAYGNARYVDAAYGDETTPFPDGPAGEPGPGHGEPAEPYAGRPYPGQPSPDGHAPAAGWAADGSGPGTGPGAGAGYAEPGYAEGTFPSGRYHDQPYGADPAGAGQHAPGYQSGYPQSVDNRGAFETESQQADTGTTPPAGPPQRVGFSGDGPVSGRPGSTTSAGLPRRAPARGPEERPAERSARTPREEAVQQASGQAPVRGPRREASQSGGTTSSGLPKRVPRANLAEHSVPAPATEGPQISRAPEDVRGRLSSLHRGVRKGRGTGTGRPKNDQQGFGPGNTYDQER